LLPSGAERLAGRLVCLVGPSGAGKDSVLDYARARLRGHADVAVARRAITRPREAGGEDHEPVSEDEFERLLAAGAFSLHWRANGLSYGIRREIDPWLGAGRTVVISGSRQHLPALLGRYPMTEVVCVTASADILRERLVRRGRERPEQVEQRLSRGDALADLAGQRAITILNDGPLEVAGEALLALLLGDASTPGKRQEGVASV